MGGYHSCFVSSNASMVCFGYNSHGQVHVLRVLVCSVYVGILCCFLLHQLGTGDAQSRGICGSSYESISNLTDIDLGTDFKIAQIMMMEKHSCALSTRDELKCWGK